MAIEEKTNEEIYVEATANSNNGVELKHTFTINPDGRQEFATSFPSDISWTLRNMYPPDTILMI